MTFISHMMKVCRAQLKRPLKKLTSHLVQAPFLDISSLMTSELVDANSASLRPNYSLRTKSSEMLREKIAYLERTLTQLWALLTQASLKGESPRCLTI